MSDIIKLEPKQVWENFDMLCANPRPSKHEEKVKKAIIDYARKHNIHCVTDKIGNIILKKPSTEGMKNRKGVILQAHVDMVPQKNADVEHDFINDPIQPWIDGEWVRAKGTTLGADNGIGVAAALAIMTDETLPHGPLEALLTIDEETGMTGAFGLESGELEGEILLNLDSETEGELYVGCAGGVDATIKLKYGTEPIEAGRTSFVLSVKGFKGGHSGMDIILQRGNANKSLFRMLKALDEVDVRLCEIEGGDMRNAIPREAMATVTLPTSNVSKAKEIVEKLYTEIKNELSETEDNFVISLEPTANPTNMMEDCCSKKIINTVYSLPNGVYRMSDSMAKLVETSSNLAIVKSEDGIVKICCLLRSSVDSEKKDLAMMMKSVVDLAGDDVEFTGEYPGWKPNMNSAILKEMQVLYHKIFNKEAKVMAIHAGLECGVMGGVYKNWDMISFGPTIEHPHSPDERVNIKSVELFYKFLVETIKNIPTK